MSTRPITKELEEQGFAVVHSLLSEMVVSNLIDQIQSHLLDRSKHSGYAMRNLVQTVSAVRHVAESAAIRELVEPVVGPGAFVVRSLFFDKTPDANWKVSWHQDLTIAVREKVEVPGFTAWSLKDGVPHVQPPVAVLERILTMRLHLDECDSTNGPLEVIAGSHKIGRLDPQQISEWRKSQPAFTCVVARGGALLMRPLLLHASSPAVEPRHRRVVHLEFAGHPLPGKLRWL